MTDVQLARKLLLFLALLLGIFGGARADEKAVQKYRSFTPQQIASMPEKTRGSEVPIMFIWAAQKGLASDIEIVFAMELNKLMYPGIADYPRAVREFQKDLGEAQTGVLNVWQIHQLGKRAEMQGLGTLTFPDQFSSFKTGSFAQVQGTLTILDDKIAYPINHQNITCSKERGRCEMEQLLVIVPDDNSFAQTYIVRRDTTPDLYRITKWDEDSIEGSMETETRCRIVNLTLNFKTKEFYQITRNGGGDCSVMGTEMPRLDKPRISQIVDGKKIIAQEFGKVREAAFKAMASDFQRKVNALIAKDKSR